MLLGAPGNNAGAPSNYLNFQNCPLLKINKKKGFEVHPAIQISSPVASISSPRFLHCHLPRRFFVAFLSPSVVYAGLRLDNICVLLVAQGKRRRFFRSCVNINYGRRFFSGNARKKVFPCIAAKKLLPRDLTEEPSSTLINQLFTEKTQWRVFWKL